MKKAIVSLFALFVFVFLGFAQAQAPQQARTAPDEAEVQASQLVSAAPSGGETSTTSQTAKQAPLQTQIMKVDDVHPGMKGVS
ncbi:MAG TPA: hypothetical protein VFB76_17500, partial [Candidatus Angelobacter sp.]|nr:hypothetical protein [Candidatus Angelobacter sp.]